MKSYFVSSVSHDLKTPLTSIRLFAELLHDSPGLPFEQKSEYLGIIEGEAERLSRLITNVLDFAMIEKGSKDYLFKHVDLNEIAQNVRKLLEYQIRSNGFVLNFSLHPETLLVSCDRDAVTDAIINLITNAMKYSPADRRYLSLSTTGDSFSASVAIEDHGVGITALEAKNIFDPFYRVENGTMKSAGGAGLGLSLVKHTLDAHAGTVEVTSVPGKGSIFVLHFPRYVP